MKNKILLAAIFLSGSFSVEAMSTATTASFKKLVLMSVVGSGKLYDLVSQRSGSPSIAYMPDNAADDFLLRQVIERQHNIDWFNGLDTRSARINIDVRKELGECKESGE